MPPRAIASQVASTIASDAVSPVRAWWRSSISSTIDGGNFGAPPKPPRTTSYVLCRDFTAASSWSAEGGASPGGRDVRSARAATMRRALDSTSSRRSCQASLIDASSWRNDGMPWRGSGGK
jgi:hypothetical protein